MAATIVPSANIVHKVLNQDNYVLWSFRVKTYLLTKDLWSVVKPTNEPPKLEEDEVEFNIWSKKNVEALHIIHICCGDDMFPFIYGLDTAKAAWDTLEAKFNSTIFQTPDERSLINTVNAGNTHGDVEESVPLMTIEDLRREFSEEDVSDSESTKDLLHSIQHLIPEYGGIRNALFIASVESGDLELIKSNLADYPEVIKARSSSTGATALYSAIMAGHELVVKELVDLMSAEDLEVQGMQGITALYAAATVGNIQITKYIVEKNERLVTLRCLPPNNPLPLLTACFAGKWELARYLYSVTPLEALTHEQNGREGAQLISHSFYSQEFDIALDLIHKCPSLTLAKDYSGNSPLYVLSTARSTFLTGTRLTPWQKLIYHSIQIQPATSIVRENIEDDQGNQRNFITHSVIGCFRGLNKNLLHLLGINHIRKKKLVHVRTLEMLDFMCEVTQGLTLKQMQEGIVQQAILQAVEQGNVEFVRKMCEANPMLLAISDGKGKSLFQFSIECRQEKVYCFLFGSMPETIRKSVESGADKFGNSTLHSAASLSSIAIAQLNHIQGAALQLQRELQWFKEVESIVPPKIHDMVNYQDRMTARELFTKNHKEMVKEGERQMKEIATSCTVVGALIVTMMFAAAFTIPGGTNGATGMPMFLYKKLFKVFIVSDSISLFSSTTSIVIFLGILTSRYAEDDFLKSLPKKMVIGLFTLFFSIATMMIAFVSALIIMLHGTTWIIILVVFLASIPITSFAWMQFPLLVEILISTFGRGRFHKKVEFEWLGVRSGK